MRNELDDDDAAVLIKEMRALLREEWMKEFSKPTAPERRLRPSQSESKL